MFTVLSSNFRYVALALVAGWGLSLIKLSCRQAGSLLPFSMMFRTGRTSLGVALALCALPAGAYASDSSPTRQAVAVNGEFLTTAAAPAELAAICVIDTGVTVTQDLTDSVIYRYALDGGSVDDQDTGTYHGTTVAQVATAAQNGWGSVGIAPQVKIVSVRASSVTNPTHYDWDDYVEAIDRCGRLSAEHDLNVKVINLSLGDLEASADEQIAVEEQMRRAETSYDMNVIAAAGNSNVNQVSSPANFSGVLAVGASDTSSGALCSFSNYGTGLDISAPGCNIDAANTSGSSTTIQGTSYSAPVASAALAALRSYRPDLTADQAEQLLLDSAQQTSAGDVLDITAMFEAAGLSSYIGEELASGDPISAGQGESDGSDDSAAAGGSSAAAQTTSSTAAATATATTSSTASSTTTAAATTAKRGLKAPKVISKYRSRKRLYLWLDRIPRGVTVTVKLGSRTLKFRGSKLSDQIVTVRLRRWRKLKLRFESKALGRSPWTKVAKTALASQP